MINTTFEQNCVIVRIYQFTRNGQSGGNSNESNPLSFSFSSLLSWYCSTSIVHSSGVRKSVYYIDIYLGLKILIRRALKLLLLLFIDNHITLVPMVFKLRRSRLRYRNLLRIILIGLCSTIQTYFLFFGI